MKVTRVGIDLAKEVFQIHGVDGHGKTLLRRKLRRSEMMKFFKGLSACLIGLEACASSHHWARRLSELGHTVKLIAPQFVKPYVKGNKNDANDAEAICEAVGRPSMRFVPIKTVEQQNIQALHRIRTELVRQRTAKVNQIRGLLGEYGIVARQGVAVLRKALFAKSVVKHGVPWPRPAIERVSDQGLIRGPSSETIPGSLRGSEWRRH